ncbi:protein of unknown function [Pararobbsia alpina]
MPRRLTSIFNEGGNHLESLGGRASEGFLFLRGLSSEFDQEWGVTALRVLRLGNRKALSSGARRVNRRPNGSLSFP